MLLYVQMLSEKEIGKILDSTPMIKDYVKKHNSDEPDFFRHVFVYIKLHPRMHVKPPPL